MLSYGGTSDPNVRLDEMALLTDKRAQQCGCEGGAVERLSATATRQHWGVSGACFMHVSIARLQHHAASCGALSSR